MNKKIIIVPFKMVKELAEQMNCTERTVYNALRFKTNGKKSLDVRKLAEKKLIELNGGNNNE